jgi:drug/metabolite transporter (DMT)-like permease
MNMVLLLMCGLLISIIYALGKTATQSGMNGLDLMFWQISGSVLIVLPVALWKRQLPLLCLSHVRYYLSAGLLGFTGPYLVTYWVLNHIPSGLVGVVASLSPLMTVALVVLIFRQRIRWAGVLGLLAGFAGVLTILLPKSSLPNPDMLAWVLIACLSPLFLAMGNVYRTRAWPADGQPVQMAAGLLTSQWLLLLPIQWMSAPIGLPELAARPSVAGIAVSSGLFYLLSFQLQRRTTPVFVGQLGYVIAVCSLVIGTLFFNEHPSPWVWAGTALIAGGVFLVSRSSMPIMNEAIK